MHRYRRASLWLLLLTVSACFGFAFYRQVLMRFWLLPPLGEAAVVVLLSIGAGFVFHRWCHKFVPPDWSQWQWYSKFLLLVPPLFLSFFLLYSGLLPLNNSREVIITIEASQQEKVETYYFTGVFDRNGKRIVTPTQLAEEADIFKGFKVVNNGNGLWCRIPEHGQQLHVSWRGSIQTSSFPLSLGFASNPNAGVVIVGLGGMEKTVNLRSGPGANDRITNIELPDKARLTPTADFVTVLVVLAGILCRPLFWLLGVLKTDIFIPLSALAEKYPAGFLVLLIAIPVIGFNMVHVFGPKYLLQDDPLCYREGIEHLVTWWLWTEMGFLSAFTEGLSWWMMAHYSPYIVRLLFVVIYLSGISLCMYWVARRIFNLSPVSAYLAAVLPAIYPIQAQIIAGINLSYSLVGTLVALLSLIAGFCYLVKERHSWGLLLLAGGLYVVSTRLMEQAVFLSAALGFIYLMTSRHWKRKILLLLPVALAAATVLLRMMEAPRTAATPQHLPWDVIFSRTSLFFKLLSPIQGGFNFVLPCLVVLLVVGTGSFFLWPALRDRINVLPYFSWLPEKLRLLVLPAFVILWTLPSVLPFLGMTPSCGVRMFHVAGYGPWLLMAPGLAYLLSSAFSFLNKQDRKNIIIIVTAGLIFLSGFQHMLYAEKQYETGNYYWTSLSLQISNHAFPEGSEIVITNASIGSGHKTYLPCSGYLSRMLGNRLDIGGLVGPEYYFYDPFAQGNIWVRPMTGIKSRDNLHLFRWVPEENTDNPQKVGSLVPYQYFLRVISDESEKAENQQTGDWVLYLLENNYKATPIHSGHGHADYEKLLADLKGNGIEPRQILWGDPKNELGCNSPEMGRERTR